MSGFEIAGIVLGAFPIAINALDAYRDIAQRLGLFQKIRLEYKKWRDDLEFYKVAFTRNLRQLLLPLVADDQKIEELLLEPGGDCWKEESLAEVFEKRLQESYQLYMQYIQDMKRVLDEINQELAIDSQWADKLLDSSRLFDELKEYNDKLEMLLRSSDEDIRLVSNRQSKKSSESVEMAICGFWKKAKSVFQALANAWICQCPQHCARLLLQHRTEGRAEFELLLTGFIPPSSGVHRVRVSEGGDMIEAQLKESVTLMESMPSRQPGHKQSRPLKSALKTKSSKQSIMKFHSLSPSVTLTSVNTMPTPSFTREILNLCTTFGPPERSCYGYITHEDYRYYVYNISQPEAKAMRSVTLDQILRGELHPMFTRLQTYTLSLIIASTYLQLLESPWLPKFPKRVDIAFHYATEDGGSIRLDEPHISQHVKGSHQEVDLTSAGKHFRFAALDHLGIMLLELCFGRTMEDQPWRKALPDGENDAEKAGYDILAAREWLCHVNEEAGPAYADAVSWCFTGNRCAPEEKWRQGMLRNVVEPLKQSRDFLANGGIEA